MKLTYTFSTIISTALLLACGTSSTNNQEETTMEKGSSITTENFGSLQDGTAVKLFTLTNNNGVVMKVTDLGGIITSLSVPDREGRMENVVLGHGNLKQYEDGHPFFGALVGRYGNRIAKARFTLDGTEYTLAQNNGENHLHGGLKGFDKKVWATEPFESDAGVGLVLNYTSPDMEEGYPGTLSVTVTYTLTDDNLVKIDYKAITDKKTVVNLTNHSYFNLSGKPGTPVLNHEMQLLADRFLPVDSTLIPVGELRPVSGTPFDFRSPKAIGLEIDKVEDQQIAYGGGYDHCWVFNNPGATTKVAEVYEPTTGRVMEMFTTEPGVQFYTGNFLNGNNIADNGTPYGKRSGFCLETQHYPDSPNQADFPTVVLEPGNTYETSTAYRFSAR